MKNMKKILCFALVIAMVAIASVGLTVAYLTDRDSKANIFTVGEVEIELNEAFDAEGAVLIPGVNIEKAPTIKNTGKNDAWVWATIAIPAALDDVNAAYKNIVHFNYTKESVEEGFWSWTDNDGWMVETVEINGIDYNVYTVMYETALKPGAVTEYPVMTKVYLDTHVDVAPDGEMNWIEQGVATKIGWNVNTNQYPTIYVSAYAIQAEGFETVVDAYNAYQAQWGDNGAEYATQP